MVEEKEKVRVIEKISDEVCTHHTYHHNDNEIQKYSEYLQGKYYPLVNRLEREADSLAKGHEVTSVGSDEIRSNE